LWTDWQQQRTKRIHIGLGGVAVTPQYFRRTKVDRSAVGHGVLCVYDSRQTKVRDLNGPVLVHEQVGGLRWPEHRWNQASIGGAHSSVRSLVRWLSHLEISVNNWRHTRVEVQHALGSIDGKLLLHAVRQANLLVLQHVVQAASFSQLGHNVEMRRVHGRSQELSWRDARQTFVGQWRHGERERGAAASE